MRKDCVFNSLTVMRMAMFQLLEKVDGSIQSWYVYVVDVHVGTKLNMFDNVGKLSHKCHQSKYTMVTNFSRTTTN